MDLLPRIPVKEISPLELLLRAAARFAAISGVVAVLVWLTCTLDGLQVFRVEPSSGIAANPYFEFFVRPRTSADMVVQWQDDLGVMGVWRQRMDVAERKAPGP